MPKYVISSTLTRGDWNKSIILNGDVPVEVSKLRTEVAGDIVVHGSATLVQALLEHSLVDELHLMVFPVLLGKGKKLFGDLTSKKPNHLVESKIVGDGIAILSYLPS